MSLLVNRISKSSACRVANGRFFSTFSESPCFLVSGKTEKVSLEGGKVVSYKVFDPRTEEVVTSCEKKVPKELIGQTLVGASQGWVASVDLKDHSVYLTDLYKPRVSSPRVISLPSLGFYPSPHATALSLSSSSPGQDQEFTLAAKFYGTHLSVCKPYWDSEWTHIETSVPLLPSSDLMYSNRDKAFYFTSVKGLYMGSFHLGNNKLKYQELRLCKLPKIPEAGWEMLDKCFTSKHLVESPYGEHFLVKWYTQCIHNEKKDGEALGFQSKTKRFMVFREDMRTKEFHYTQDIGDLCIFLGKSEAFCLKATKHSGLKPNSVYYIGHGLGSYDLASGTVHSFNPPRGSMLNNAPFWIPPLPSS